MVIEVEHPVWGTLRETGNPIKTGAAEPAHRPAPALGQDTDTVLSELLGFDAAEIAALRAAGAV